MSETTPQEGDQRSAAAEGPDSIDERPSDPSTTPADTSDPIRRERDELRDRLLRTAAEFDNYRKRMERERRELAESAAGDVLLEILPILDNFERALQTQAGDADTYRQGVELIHKQFVDLLRKRHIVALETAGQPFDPNFHQAVVREVTTEYPDGTIIEELQRGYMLKERLLRPAMVKVAAEP